MYLFSSVHDRPPRSAIHTPLIRYSISLLSVVLALFITLQVPAIRSGTPFLCFFLAITVSAGYGGMRAGLLAIALATLSVAYWILPPVGSLPSTLGQLIQIVGFLIVAGAITGLMTALQRERSTVITQREALQLTLASIGDAVIVTDAQGAVRWVNQVAAMLTGWSISEAEGRPLAEIFNIVNEQTRSPIENPVNRVLSEGRVFGLANHTLLINRAGVEYPIEDSAAPIRDPQGMIHGVVLVFHDITERTQAEAALRANEEKLTKIFNASPLVITITTLADGRLIEVNDSFIQFTGHRRDEVIGRTPVEIGLWVEPTQRVEGLAQLQRGHFQRNTEFRFRMKDGSERICLTSAEMLTLNNQRCVLTVLTDITERKQAELARQAAEERFAKAFRASPQAMCITRVTDGCYIDVNESFARLVDYPYAEIIGHTSFDVGIWTDPQLRAAVNQRIIDQGNNRDFEHRFYTRKGEVRDIVSAGVTLEVNGEPCILSVINDVTMRKQAEEALQESEARFRATFEQAAIGVAHISPEGHYLSVNQRLCEITGYSQAALLQKMYQAVVHPDDLTSNIAHADRLLKGEIASYTLEQRYLRPDKSVLWVNLTESTVRDKLGAVKYRVAMIEDISARKVAEARLVFLAETSAVLASSLDYEMTLQQVASLLVPALADLCTVELLKPDHTITPVVAVHINPTKLAWVQQLRDLYPPRFTDSQGIGQVLQTGRSAFYPVISEERLLASAPNAVYRTLLQQIGFKSVMIVPLQVRTQIFGTLTFAWSESDRHYTPDELHLAEEVAKRAALAVDNALLYQAARQAESELRQLNERLEEHVATRTAELQRSNQELDRFAYVASHDLKAPLRAIELLANWISQDTADILPAASQLHLTKLCGRVQRMNRLLDDLLAYSRAGRLSHRLEAVDTAELVHSTIDWLAPPAGFTVRLAENFPTLITERVPLETILRNLIGNAIKHHDHPESGQVVISATEHEHDIEFSITDDGPGVDPQFHERIFQMFQTLQPRDRVEGSGMGLAIVKKLVEKYSGTIQVESNIGQGATFRFTWPKLDKSAADSESHSLPLQSP